MSDSTIEIGRREAQAIRQAIQRSDPQRMIIRKAAVLGAGVMGAQIAAHLANANVKPILFDLPAKEGKDKSANANKAIDGLAKQLNPSPLATASAVKQIVAANYDEHLHLLKDCDLVIEAISERMDWKKSLFEKVAPHIGPNAIFASNTSGLSITELVEGAARGAAQALLRHPLLQPAALHAPGGDHPHRRHRPGDPRPPRDLPHHHARQGRDPRQGHAQLRRQPRRRLLDARDDAPHGRVQAGLRRSRCAHRARDRPRQERHLSHGRRGRSRHHGARREDDGRHAARGSVGRVLQGAGVAVAIDREGRARPEDQGRHLHEEGQGHPRARCREAGLPRADGSDGRRGSGDPEVEESRRAVRAASRLAAPAGAVPVGDLPRRLPLRRGAPRRDRAQRARRRLRGALGLRLAARARSSCGRPRAGSRWRSGSRRTSPPARRWRRRRCPSG